MQTSFSNKSRMGFSRTDLFKDSSMTRKSWSWPWPWPRRSLAMAMASTSRKPLALALTLKVLASKSFLKQTEFEINFGTKSGCMPLSCIDYSSSSASARFTATRRMQRNQFDDRWYHGPQTAVLFGISINTAAISCYYSESVSRASGTLVASVVALLTAGWISDLVTVRLVFCFSLQCCYTTDF